MHSGLYLRAFGSIGQKNSNGLYNNGNSLIENKNHSSVKEPNNNYLIMRGNHISIANNLVKKASKIDYDRV